jgi:hypothetical protein
VWKKNEINFDGGDFGSKKCKRGNGAPVMGLAESAFGRSLESGCQICVGVFGRNLASFP